MQSCCALYDVHISRILDENYYYLFIYLLLLLAFIIYLFIFQWIFATFSNSKNFD